MNDEQIIPSDFDISEASAFPEDFESEDWQSLLADYPEQEPQKEQDTLKQQKSFRKGKDNQKKPLTLVLNNAIRKVPRKGLLYCAAASLALVLCILAGILIIF